MMNKRVLYLEGASGISGDMTVGALLDLGVKEEKLRRELDKLPLEHYEIRIGRTKKGGLDACAFRVLVKEEHQPHRTYRDIERMLMDSKLDWGVKQLSVKIFYVLAKAEAEVHGASVDTVHFHEVGAVDSIVDIVGTAVCFRELKIDEVVVGPLHEGCGTVLCQHGEMPVPVPATTKLLSAYGLPVRFTDNQGEMITPTGAAIAAALRSREKLPGQMNIEAVGIGAGTRDFDSPNVLRAMILTEEAEPEAIWVLETNVDDCSGEQLGFLQERLLELGVRDAFFRPVYMKKSRPAYVLTVLCQEELTEQAEELIFSESTTIGIRRFRADRSVLERRIERIHTEYGEIRVKVCCRRNQTFVYPEYEDVRRVAIATGSSYRQVYEAAAGKVGELNGDA